MRILQIHNRYREPGGEDTVVDAEAKLLRSAGHEVHQFQAENPSQALPAAARLAASSWNALAAKRVRNVVASFQPEVAHVHNTWFSLTTSVLANLRRLDIPVVMTLHNYRFMCANGQLFRQGAPCEVCVGQHPWNAVRYRCYRGSIPASAMAASAITINSRRGGWEQNVDVFLALTEFARKRFIAAGLPADRIRVKPNFVDDPGPRPKPPSASTTVLYVGRVSPEKGLVIAQRAWASAPPGLELLVIGDGPQRAELENEGWGRVRFVGRLGAEETRRHMLEARALLFPSLWYEGLPMVILEAFAAGLPVLGSDLGSIAEVLSLTADLRVSPSDVVGWEQALRRLSDATLLNTASRHVRAAYEARYTPEDGLTALDLAYRSVSD